MENRQMQPTRRSRVVLSSALALLLFAGCAARPKLGDPATKPHVRATLDASTESVWPGKRVKFWIDVENVSESDLSVPGLSIELTASPADDPDKVSIRRTWGYRWPREITIAAGKKLTTPIVPEQHRLRSGNGFQDASHHVTSEFALDQLAPGPYVLRAIVNEVHVSSPFAMDVRPPPALRPRS